MRVWRDGDWHWEPKPGPVDSEARAWALKAQRRALISMILAVAAVVVLVVWLLVGA